MKLDSRSLFEFALCLEKKDCEQEDVKWRTCISRYYYSALLYARDSLARMNAFEERGDETTHRGVIVAYGRMGDEEARRLQRTLRDFRTLRNSADYGESVHPGNKQAAVARKWASKIRTWVDAIEKRAS